MPPDERESNSAPVPHSLDRRRGVLVVDDDEGIRALMPSLLRTIGFNVFVAAGCDEALALYAENRAAIDIALLDVLMPYRDGPETLAELHALSPALPCCFMTGDSGQYTTAELLGFGASCVLHKPFQTAELATALNLVCRRKQ